MKDNETLAKLGFFGIAFAGIVVLIALGKIPATSLEYILFWAAGQQSGKLGLLGPKTAVDPTEDKP